MAISVLDYLLFGAVSALAMMGVHFLVRRSLAPTRLVETHTPKDIGLAFREVRIATENGLTLYGWFIPQSGTTPAPAVVLLHGWGGNAETLLPLVTPLWQAGFTTLLFDARCHGRSDEDSFASMPRFSEDLGHAFDWLGRQTSVDPRCIAVVGHSVGASAALLTASKREDVAAVVSIASFAHPEVVMRRLLASRRIPYWPVGWYILRYVQHVIGHRFDAIAPLNTIGQVRCPTLLVHGDEDMTVPLAEAYALYAARGDAPVQLEVVHASHEDFGDIEQQATRLVVFLSGHFRRSKLV